MDPASTPTLRSLLTDGGCIENAWLTIGDPYLAEMVAASGDFTAITLDMQHGLMDQTTAIECIRAVQGTGSRAMARLPNLNAALIGILLDAAIDGLILPQTNSKTEAEGFVAACQYPPDGVRSFGPTRAGLINPDRRDAPVTFCMIETMSGLDSVQKIALTKGLDGLFIGPGDLGISLGIGPGQDRTEPEYLEAVAKVVDAAAAAGKAVGIHANSPAFAAEKANEGFQLVTKWVDAVAIRQSIRATADEWRQQVTRNDR